MACDTLDTWLESVAQVKSWGLGKKWIYYWDTTRILLVYLQSTTEIPLGYYTTGIRYCSAMVFLFLGAVLYFLPYMILNRCCNALINDKGDFAGVNNDSYSDSFLLPGSH